MEVRLLGPIDAVDDHGNVVPLGGPKERTVLAVLACHAGEAVRAERIIDAVWGEDPPRTARKTLHAYVSRLRRALDGGIETVVDGYKLTIPVDRWRVESLILEAREASATGDASRAAELLATAAATWRGDSLGGLANEPFASTTAAQLDELRIVCIEEGIAARLRTGDTSGLEVELEAHCLAHPFRERLWGQRMIVLYRSGRQAEALRAYDALRRSLREELGIDPSPEIRQLHGAILRQDASLAAPDVIVSDGDPAPTAGSAPTQRDQVAHRVARYSLNAGRDAIAHGATDDALRILRRGIAAADVEPGPPAELLADLYLAVAQASLLGGDPEGTRVAAYRASELATGIGSIERSAEAALLLQRWAQHGEPDPDLRELLRWTIAELEPTSALRAQVMAALAGYLCWCEGDLAAGRAIQEQAIELAEATGDRVALFDASTMRTWGDTYEGVDPAPLIALAEEIGDPASIALALRNRLVTSLKAGDRDAAERDRAALLAIEGDYLHAVNNGIMETCFTALDGRFQDAEAHAFQRLALGPGMDLPGAVALTYLAAEMGRAATATGFLETMLIENPSVVGVRAILASMHAQLGDAERAAAHLQPLTEDRLSIVPRDSSLPGTLAYLAITTALLEDAAAATTVSEQLELRTEAILVLPAGIACLGPRSLFLALTQLGYGDLDRAIGNLEDAIRTAGAMRSAPMLANARLWLGDALLRRGDDTSRAWTTLKDAADAAERMGMHWVATRAEQLLG